MWFDILSIAGAIRFHYIEAFVSRHIGCDVRCNLPELSSLVSSRSMQPEGSSVQKARDEASKWFYGTYHGFESHGLD